MNQCHRPRRANLAPIVGRVCASLIAVACGSDAGSQAPSSEDTARGEPRAPSVNAGPRIGSPPSPTPAAVVAPAAPIAAAPSPDADASPADDPAGDDAPPPASEPAAPRRCDTIIGFDDLYSAIDADLADAGGDAPFVRYLSLANRVNQGICPEDLEADRITLVQTLNSLSTQLRIAAPEAIDAERTLYRVDLRDYGWDEPARVGGVDFTDKWEAIVAASPYAVEFEGGDADAAKASANTRVPLLSADAFIDVASIGDVYYALVGVGETEGEFLAQLGIDEAAQDVVRVGTGESRMSRQDTVAERFDIDRVQGFYWRRYDLADASGGESIFANPLGFRQDSTAAVFSLPNGLNGFALFDAAGVRQAETDVIGDPLQPDGRMRSSISCRTCHAGGLVAMSDQVRPYVEANPFDLDADTRSEVLDSFPAQAEIDEILRQDGERQRSALARAGIEDGGADRISGAYLRFEGEVTLSVAAGELGVSAGELERELALVARQGAPALALLASGSLRREQFDALYLSALCTLQASGSNRPLAADCAALAE